MSQAISAFAPLRERAQEEMLRRAPEHLDRLGWSAKQIADHQRERLRSLLDHAREHSPFHARRLREVDCARFELGDLTRLPVMTKSQMMDEFDEVVTDRRITRALCEEALAGTAKEPRPLYDAYVCLSSGGSSGRRGLFVKDLDGWVAFSMSLKRSTMKRLLLAGGPPPGGMTMALIAAGSAVHPTGAAPAWTAGDDLFRFHAVPVTLPLGEIVEQLNALRPDVLYGYPSILARLAREQRAGRLCVSPESIHCTSENLSPEWRAAISAAFRTPIFDTFGSTEGLTGVSEPDDVVLTFNSDECIVELVDAAGEPVPSGVPSSRILLTNLSNRIQPLIRYEIGDRFVRLPDAPGHGHLRALVDGRADDVLRFGPTEIHPLVIRSVLVKTPEALDYQVRQTARGIELDVQVEHPLDLEPLRRELEDALSAAGLNAPEVVARCVSGLERHGETGKLRRFISC